MTEATRTGLYTARWHLNHDDPVGALRVVNTLLTSKAARQPVATRNPEPDPEPVQSIGDAIAAIGESQIGVREVGHNTGLEVKRYQAATHLGGTGWAWCAAFICWCVQQAAHGRDDVRFKMPATAGARDLQNWAEDIDNETGRPRPRSGGKAAGVRVLGSRERLERGDLIVFDRFSHCAILTRDENARQFDGREEHFTIEGNTNRAGSREGDGVYAKRRGLRTGAEKARCAIRLTTAV